jgi:CheY-like chemotaxis protein
MSEEQKGEPAQILVADDDPAILRLVKAIVEKEGYVVISARDGREAYKLLTSGEQFVAAIFDVVMPYIQGTVGKASDENSGDNDDGGTKSASLI